MTMDISQITSLVDNGEYDKAKTLINKVISQKGKDKELVKYLGLCNVNLGLQDEALENFEQIISEDSNDALSMYYIAVINLDKGNVIKAEALLKKVIELRENYADAYRSLAIIYFKQNRINELFAMKETLEKLNIADAQIYDVFAASMILNAQFGFAIGFLKKSIEIEPENPKYYIRLGIAYFSAGDINSSIEQYKKALKLDKNSSEAYYNMGLAYFALEEFDLAHKNLKKSYKLDQRSEFLSTYALVSLKGGFFKDAINAYEKLSESNPDKENYKYNLSCAYEGNNELDKAIAIMEKLHLSNPNSIQLKLQLASLYSKKGIIEGAKMLYFDVINDGFADENIMYEYSLLCAKTGETDRAEEFLKKIIEINPNHAMAYKDLGIIYLSRRFFDRALENFKKAYKIAPENIFIIFEFGNYYHLMSDFENAKKMYNKLLKMDDIPVYMLVCIASNYISINMISKAKNILLKAIEIEPKNVEVLYNLAQIYYMEKNYENSRQLLEDAYNMSPNTEIGNLLARVCMEMGDYNQAYGLFNVVNLIVPNNISVMLSMAECKFRQKDYEKAKKHVNSVLKLLPEHEEALELLKKIDKE